MNQPTVFVLEDDLPLLGIFDAFLTEEGYRVVGWTTSALDRLVHHAEVVSINGRSYRMRHRMEADRPPTE